MSNLQQCCAEKPTLIFPAGMPRSLDYLDKCRREGKPVIGSSSLSYDVSKEKYSTWSYLPYITEPEFNDALKTAISEFDIGGIYTPNPVVWNYLNRVLKDINSDIALVNDFPVKDELSGYHTALSYARQVLEKPLQLASSLDAKVSISEMEIATLFKHGNMIPGMCDDEKICALCEIAKYAPRGDVVEIGSAWGKSAFILARLAQCYGIGKTLCVDPWKREYLVQNDKGGLVDSGIAQYDGEESLLVFEMNLLPYSKNDINYLRLPSTEAAQHYRERRSATTASFGTTDYCGSIAILHIDGNHSHAAVEADIAAWGGLVAPSGWIIFDDYVWPYGDGPKEVGDAFLAENRGGIDVAFVMGSALFLQLSAQPAER